MRITYIDTAKGIGIFLVALGHIVPEIFAVAPIIYCFWVPLFLQYQECSLQMKYYRRIFLRRNSYP